MLKVLMPFATGDRPFAVGEKLTNDEAARLFGDALARRIEHGYLAVETDPNERSAQPTVIAVVRSFEALGKTFTSGDVLTNDEAAAMGADTIERRIVNGWLERKVAPAPASQADDQKPKDKPEDKPKDKPGEEEDKPEPVDEQPRPTPHGGRRATRR